jgi:DNA-binding response OmpR family regulator
VTRKILIIEDDGAIRSTLALRLEGEGYNVATASSGVEGIEKANEQPIDLILLDVMLPDRSGWDVCRDLRQAGMTVPIVFLTARTQDTDKVIGLKLGGDDYVTKPFRAAELVARIEALLRHAPSPSGRVYQFGNIRVDVQRGEVSKDGNPVYLTAHEFQLLRYLMERPDIVVSREDLLTRVWGYGSGAVTRTIDKHVASLRSKLEASPRHPELILTVEGFGYKFVGSRDS